MKNFKGVIILTVTVLASVISMSCSSDDSENGGNTDNNLIGTWKEISLEQKEYLNGDLISDTTTSPEADEIHLVTFRSDDTFTSNSNSLGEISSGTYSIDGDTITIVEEDSDDDDFQIETKYKVEGNTLYVTGEHENSFENNSYKFEFKITFTKQ